MARQQAIQQIDSLAAQLSQLRQNLSTDMPGDDAFIQLHEINRLVAQYCKEHDNRLGDFSLLANISANTLTRVLRAPQTSKVETINSVLKVIGKQLYIGDRND
jgi:hypothetical protein